MMAKLLLFFAVLILMGIQLLIWYSGTHGGGGITTFIAGQPKELHQVLLPSPTCIHRIFRFFFLDENDLCAFAEHDKKI
jgi:hypothetical protein